MTETQADALRALIEKVEAGDEPNSRECLAALKVRVSLHIGQAFNGSLDHAKSLHEAVVPGWDWDASSAGGTEGRASTKLEVKGDPEGWEWCWGVDADPARAWLLAILRARLSELSAQTPKGEQA